MFGIPQDVKNQHSIKIMIVDMDEPKAVEELSSFLSTLKPSDQKPLEGNRVGAATILHRFLSRSLLSGFFFVLGDFCHRGLLSRVLFVRGAFCQGCFLSGVLFFRGDFFHL